MWEMLAIATGQHVGERPSGRAAGGRTQSVKKAV
jgi:hypothetical protein